MAKDQNRVKAEAKKKPGSTLKEKRKAKQEKLHLHRLGNALKALRQEMIAFFEQFADGSTDLLRYTGLHPPY